LEYLGEKSTEISKMGPADILLGRAVAQAKMLKKAITAEYIRVGGVHPIHPVGSWREDTWAKTLGRKDDVLSAVDKIVEAGGKLTKADIDSTPSLRSMRSQTNFEAVPFAFNGFQYVTMEGNGRLKGMQLAAQERPQELGDLAVEVDLYHYNPDSLQTVQEGILELWNQYVEEAFALDRNANTGAQLHEYASFAVSVVKCAGTYEGWASPRSSCKVENKLGEELRSIPVGTLLGVAGKCNMPNGGSRYKLYPGRVRIGGTMEYAAIGEDEYLVEGRDSRDMVAFEYCQKCMLPIKCEKYYAF
jgi:hypothetical protein